MNTYFSHRHFIPLLVFIGLLQSCQFNQIDYPPHDSSKLKGPPAKSLETRTFQLAEAVTYPFYGTLLHFNQQFLLFGHNEAAGRLATLTASIVTELPKSDLTSLFSTPSGSIWGIKSRNETFLLRHLVNGSWVEVATIDGTHYQTVRVTEQELWFTTSRGLIIWNRMQNKISQRIGIDRSRVFTNTFSVESVGDELKVYANQDLETPISRFPLPAYLTVRKGISNAIWGVFEDKNQHLWLVVKDANWDGVLLKFDGKNLTNITTIPVGDYDSGRSASNFNQDKTGNLWVQIDGVNYVYTQEGKWILPRFNAIENTLYAGTVFTDAQGNPVIATYQKLFSITL